MTEVMKNAKVFTDKYDMDPRVASLTGINLEGPFLSPKKPGAQNPDNIVKTDVEMVYRLNEASGNKIKLIDIAPETEGALEFIKSCKDKFVISIAHTDATYEDSCAAIEAGARHITHLYNAMNPIHHRNPGPVIAAFESGAEVELIADGVHIHPAMVRFTFQIFDRDRVILISDSMEACGLADGEYQLGGQPVMKNGNLATLKKDGATVAGSVTNLFDCMKTAVQKIGIPLEDAICAATMNPARSIGISNDHGSIAVGKYADIVIIDNELNIVHVINKGEIIR